MKKYVADGLPVLLVVLMMLYATKIRAQATDTLPPVKVIAFAPGELPTKAISSAAPAFTPDGKIVILGQSFTPGNISIMEAHLDDDNWSAPEMPDFSGKYRDLEPVFSPDGTYVIFASNRPAKAKGQEIDGYYNGRHLAAKGGNLWKMKYAKRDWGKPERLPDIINSNSSVFSPSVAADGSLYFMRADSGKKFHIYRSQMHHGKYEMPVPASFTDENYGDFDPAVSPDESFMIFSSTRPPAQNSSDLFIVFREKNEWSKPIDLRSALSEKVYGTEARLSRDGKTLYFTNSHNALGENVPNAGYIWKVDLSKLLKAYGVL
jgi:Tol biopolymer transport system component